MSKKVKPKTSRKKITPKNKSGSKTNKEIKEMEKSGNPKLNFSTKYNFDFVDKEKMENKECELNPKDMELNSNLLSSMQKNEFLRKQDQQVQYSFPLKGEKEKQKNTMTYLKAEHRVSGFERNISEINGK
jgi:hypothetical protein